MDGHDCGVARRWIAAGLAWWGLYLRRTLSIGDDKCPWQSFWLSYNLLSPKFTILYRIFESCKPLDFQLNMNQHLYQGNKCP